MDERIPENKKTQTDDKDLITSLEREIRILKKQLSRSYEERKNLEEIIETHLNTLMTRNSELEQSQAQLKASEERFRFLSQHDSLTGLPNRFFFTEAVEGALWRVRQNEGRIAVLFIDLDHFKAVNDNYGHDAGDLVLKAASRRIAGCLESNEFLARLGGDEFAVIIEDLTSVDPVTVLKERIQAALTNPIALPNGKTCSVGASVGVALYPEDASDMRELLQKADIAMYMAKNRI